MKNTLFPNDIILVNKLSYGPRLPRSPFEISWINQIFYLNETARSAIDKHWWPYERLQGTKTIVQGDIIVYEFFQTVCMVKRCMAAAGDTIYIKNGDVFTNGVKYISPPTVRNNYQIITDNKKRFFFKIDSLDKHFNIFSEIQLSDTLLGTFSISESKIINSLPEVRLEKKLDVYNKNNGIFAMPKDEQWSLDNMGPILIPKKGLKITLNNNTFELYNKVIAKYENEEIISVNNKFLINNIIIDSYTFKKDYFFVMGDSRDVSRDSRYIGFIPYENIIGKVQLVLFSTYNNKFQWERFFKSI